MQHKKIIDNIAMACYYLVTEQITCQFISQITQYRKYGENMKLSDCAKIRTGLVLSRKEADKKEKAHQYTALTLKAVAESGTIIHDETEPYNAAVALKQEFFTHKGDVLLRLSAPYTAVLISDNDAGLLITSHFAIIRAFKKIVDPYYLHWWLTQNRKLFYKVASGGTMMGTISSGYVGEMEIILPSIDEQVNIGYLLQLTYREQKLLLLLAEKKKQIVNSILHYYIEQKGEHKDG